MGKTACPVCKTTWFEKEGVYGDIKRRASIMREAWPWRSVKLPVKGGKGVYI
jgi:hypothetical protein